MKLPIYNLEINEDDQDTGVNFVALVDSPAIERNWVAFNKQQSFIANEDKQIISGALMVADLPIYRQDAILGEYYAVFTAETIEKIVNKFFKSGMIHNVNLMHDASQVVKGAYMIESYIINRDKGINPPKGFEGISDGSWFGSFKVENAEIWKRIKEGEFKGFSIEGAFDHLFYVDKEQKAINEIIEIIKAIE